MQGVHDQASTRKKTVKYNHMRIWETKLFERFKMILKRSINRL